ncbi:MAG: phosphoribosyltransferase family protein [Chloroflexota bacterium]|nr:phosphoribosyltransferase family protein [Chloroflexota bacterium]
MDFSTSQIIFENRRDAGRQLAAKLTEYNEKSVVVLAIPNGGVPVALEVASALKADLDVVVSRKIPMPLSPEGGFGAVADNGTIILNEHEVKRLGLSQQQIEYEARKVREKVKQRSMLYKGDRPLARLSGRTVIVVDDGLASGVTMIAAVESVRHRGCREIVVAVPVASAIAMKEVQPVAGKVVTCATGFMPKFYISDFYRQWHDLSDEEVVQYLKQWRMRRFSR